MIKKIDDNLNVAGEKEKEFLEKRKQNSQIIKVKWT